MSIDYKALQNGSDIRGVALREPDGPEVNLTTEVAERIALGFLIFLQDKLGKPIRALKVSVGMDSRVTGPSIKSAILTCIAEAGAVPMDAGLASTPAMFMSTVFPEFDCDGSIMITASHMPTNRNGMKFFIKDGGLDKEDISKILAHAESKDLYSKLASDQAAKRSISHDESNSIIEIDLMERYSSHLRDIIRNGLGAETSDAPLSGIKITVDAGNGAGGFYATRVLEPLGADISSSQFLEPDGTFPNHIPNPEDRAAMESISNKVRSEGTDLGLIFDTDVDRASAVDEQGNEIAHNGIVAMAAALIADNCPGTTVVTDSVTSNELTEYIESNLGLRHLRYKRGYRNVINKAIELNNQGIDSQLAIETSGHAAFKDNYFLDDGAYLATLIVIKAAKLAREGKAISSVLAELKSPKESLEFRLPFIQAELEKTGASFSEVGDNIIESLTRFASGNDNSSDSKNGVISELAEPNYEGVRINFCFPDDGSSTAEALNYENGSGWMLIRKSLHEPLMPLNIESSITGGAARIIEEIKPILSAFPALDISQLK